MKYIVYQTTNKVNNKIYIGVHKTENPEIFDGYLANGVYIYRPSSYMNPRTYFQYAVKKYGIKNFIRTNIKVFDTEEEAYALEAELVNQEFIERDDTYNLILGGRSTEQFMVKVYMYDLDGNFEREFESLISAAKYLNPNATGGGHLPRAIKKRHQFHGHQFSYEKIDKMPKLKTNRDVSKEIARPYTGGKVGRYDKEGNLLEVFETMTHVVKAGYNNAKKVALGQRETCKGFVFKYLD